MAILSEAGLGNALDTGSTRTFTPIERTKSPSDLAEGRRSDAAAESRRERSEDLEVREETAIDYQVTAALADEGFGFASGTFRADHMRWLYEQAFSDGTTILGLYSGERKIGHLALVHHSLALNGRIETAVALMDLFILPAFRSRKAISDLYGRAETLCSERGIRFIVAVPNEKAGGVNRRYLKLTDVAPLDIRVGFALPFLPKRGVVSHRVADLDHAAGAALLAAYSDTSATGLHWTGDRIWNRLQKPGADYAIHVGPRVLAISARRSDRRMSYTLICALLRRPDVAIRRGDIAAVTAAACRMHRRPLFVYTGLNDLVPRPGMLLPKRLRPSPMVLQLRDFDAGAKPVAFDRFEPLDFDFA